MLGFPGVGLCTLVSAGCFEFRDVKMRHRIAANHARVVTGFILLVFIVSIVRTART